VNWLDAVPFKVFMAERFKCAFIEKQDYGESRNMPNATDKTTFLLILEPFFSTLSQ